MAQNGPYVSLGFSVRLQQLQQQQQQQQKQKQVPKKMMNVTSPSTMPAPSAYRANSEAAGANAVGGEPRAAITTSLHARTLHRSGK